MPVGGKFRVLEYLKKHANRNGVVGNIDREAIANACGLSKSGVSKATCHLVEEGALISLPRKAGHPCIYKVTGKIPDKTVSRQLLFARPKFTPKKKFSLKVAADEIAQRLADIPDDTRSMTGQMFGDPLPGRSALDRMRAGR